MLTHEYLYGSKKLEPMPEKYANERIEVLTEHLQKLLSVELKKRDWTRIKDVHHAISFWLNFKEEYCEGE